MKLPRDLDGTRLASLLRPYGYTITRRTGSHMRLTSAQQGPQHHVTIPAHKELSVGTLHAILHDVASYLKIDPATLISDLFGR